jgi:LPS-assembly protein
VDPRLEELLGADPADPHIHVSSDHGDIGREGDATLSGNVSIRMGQQLLTADEAEVDANARSVVLKGSVEYLDPTMRVRGHGGSFGGGAGHFERAEFELLEQSMRGAARDARLRDETIIDLEGVRFTACPTGVDDWMIHADQITIDNDTNIGTGRGARLDFMGIPIIYAPWFTFPAGDQRKSGLLFPMVGSSSETGMEVTIPWYWNIAPNYDATITTNMFFSRGLRLDPEFRYLTERSRGTVYAEYLHDDNDYGDTRSFVDAHHVTHFEPRTRLKVDAAYTSDDNYFEDYGVGFEGTSTTFLNRVAEARTDTDHWSLVAHVQDYQTIDPELPAVDEPYSILPRLTAVGRWRDLGYGFGASVYGEATNFRLDVKSDDPEAVLGPDALRLDVEPQLDWRLDSGGAYAAASAAWRATSYALSDTVPDADESLQRNVPTFSADTGLMFERTAGSRGDRLHTLEPRLQYLYVPFRDQDEIPIFDTGLPDLNIVQLFRTNRYVGADRVGDANQVSAGITTRLLDAGEGRQLLSATLGQAFFLENPRVRLPDEPVRERSTSDLVAELELAAYKDWSAQFGYQWNPDQSHSERTEVLVQYRPQSDKVVNAGYRFRRDLVEQFDVSAAWPLTREWRGFARWVYSIREEKTLDQFIGLEYGTCCWALRVVTRRFVRNRTGEVDTSIGVQLELKGLSSVGVDYDTFLRNAIRGYSALPPEPQS